MQRTTRWPPRLWPRGHSSRQTLIGYIFISPFILGFLLWFVIPAAVSVWMVFQEWNMMSAPRFVFLGNIAAMLDDPLFWQALKVTSIYTVIAVPLGMVLAFSLAVLLNTKVRGVVFFRTLIYLPVIVPSVAGAVLWAWMLNTEFGLINLAVRLVGLPKVPWLIHPSWALPSLILVNLWTIGGGMVIYLAGLQGIPDVYYEAAEIDGGGRWAKLRHVTIPLMSPVIFFNFVMGIIGSFQGFTVSYLVTGGGPNNATLFYVLHLYRVGFRYFKMGEAAALAWVLFFLLAIMLEFRQSVKRRADAQPKQVP